MLIKYPLQIGSQHLQYSKLDIVLSEFHLDISSAFIEQKILFIELHEQIVLEGANGLCWQILNKDLNHHHTVYLCCQLLQINLIDTFHLKSYEDRYEEMYLSADIMLEDLVCES